MFTFGFLSSHIPYAAFVAFYLFYFFFPTLSKRQEENIDPQITNAKVISGEEFAPNIQDEGAIAVCSYFVVKKQIKEELAITPPIQRCIVKIPGINEKRNPESLFCFARFSRPPPTL